MEKNLRIAPFGLVLVALMMLLPCHCAAQSSAKRESSTQAAVRVWQDTMELPTYEEGPPDENPPFDQFVSNGRYNYPYTMRENLTNRVTPCRWCCNLRATRRKSRRLKLLARSSGRQ